MSFVREPNSEPIKGYRLIEPLGSGGFGEVWKCEAPGGLFKAMKFVYGNLNSLDLDAARAEQELHALERVKEVRHPFVLSMDRIEVVEGELVIVMELADKSLHDAFQEYQSSGLVGIPRDTLLRYVRDAAEALDHMNEKHNLQHLDIKPRNLFLISDRVKVADFGLVKHLERTSSSGLLGGVTPLYAPPETFSGSISERSDQYSLAIVYQELLTGQRPFNGKNARQLAQQHLSGDPELRSLPEAERPVLARALSKEPAKRFPNCLAFVRALYTARTARPEVIRSESAGGEGKRPKSMADTMENIHLEQMPCEDELLPVEIDGDALPKMEGVSQLGMTVAQPQTGALRPTLVIGLGSYGRRALLDVRCRLLDRFGDLDKVPMLRFLYIDTDPDAIKESQRGASEVAFRPHEIYCLPLQPISHYRRRQLDQLVDWLPREKLFGMPRSLKTQGSRALGRLAFTDNYVRLIARVRRELQTVCHPDSIYQTVSQTGLALRDNVPRLYVLGGACGGSSGYLPDLGYALRCLARQLHQPESPVTCFLFCGAPVDPATPPSEQANLYATLTELNHFADPAIPFAAQYGTDGPRLVDEAPAFDTTYLMTLRNRTPESRRDCLAHLGSYLFHELTTPLSNRLDQLRLKHTSIPFRSLGTYGVWFPRGLLLRLAARMACQRLLDQWQAPELPPRDKVDPMGKNSPSPESIHSLLEAARARILADSELHPEALSNRILQITVDTLEGSPRELLARLLAGIEEQSLQGLALDDPGTWAQQALSRIQDWLGGGLQEPGVTAVGVHRKSRVTRALEEAAAHLAADWNRRLGETIAGLTDHPGHRLAIAETAIRQLMRYCEESVVAQRERITAQTTRVQQAQKQLQNALQACVVGVSGFSWFGNKTRRLLRVFVDHLAAFARQALSEDSLTAVLHFYSALQGHLGDRLRDLTFCRQRLRHLQQALVENEAEAPAAPLAGGEDWSVTFEASPAPVLSAETFWQSIRESATVRVVLPAGATDLKHAARDFLATLTEEHWTQLDQVLSDQILVGRGGLQKACLGNADLIRHLGLPLVNQAITCLGDHLPITDVAQVELPVEQGGTPQPTGREASLAQWIQTYHRRATPLVRTIRSEQKSGTRAAVMAGVASAGGAGGGIEGSSDGGGSAPSEHSFLLIPASEAGKHYGEQARLALAELQLVNVPGQANLMFCREQDVVNIEDLERLLQSCRTSYEEAIRVVQLSPHARFDIQDWVPLDP
jgi:serine/threonine protein kinase